MNRTNKAINSQYAVSQFLPFGEVRRGCYYDAHGNMLTMPHLTSMGWDYLDQLHSAANGTFTAYYNYDAEGKRTRKVVVKGNIREERYYIGDYEVYRKHINNTLDTERNTLHLSDDEKRFAIIDTLTVENGEELDPYQVTIRYQYDNHLGSACLELDESAGIISYEEYHPFGTTSYRSGRSQTEVSLKRYKYCGKERDEETGLYYYGMRYYAAWICRFVSVDPLQFKYPELTPFQYASNAPISYIDLDGAEKYQVYYQHINKNNSISKCITIEFVYSENRTSNPTYGRDRVDYLSKDNGKIIGSKSEIPSNSLEGILFNSFKIDYYRQNENGNFTKYTGTVKDALGNYITPPYSIPSEHIKETYSIWTHFRMRIIDSTSIYFANDKFKLNGVEGHPDQGINTPSEQIEKLKEFGQLLANNPEYKIFICGYTDKDASDSYNLDLSQKRIDTIVKYLMENYNIDSSRIITSAKGETKADQTVKTDENRKVELTIINNNENYEF